jgi:hypothetical protein
MVSSVIFGMLMITRRFDSATLTQLKKEEGSLWVDD